MAKKTIFIHILKTGGTSIVCELNNTEWQIKPNFFYRHIFYETKKSNSEDIFNKENFKKYQEYNLFMFVRDPLERLFSEYYYLKDRPEFLALLSKKPTSFFEYCCLQNTQNGMIKFLLGQRIYSNKKIGETEYNKIINAIENIPIKIGVFERYEESLSYLAESFNLEWSEIIEKKRVTIYKPSKIELSEEQIQIVKSLNRFDYMLYEVACEKLNNSKFSQLDIKITGSKYDYVNLYTQRFVLFEPLIKNKKFLIDNKDFFNKLNVHIHKTTNNGKEYVKIWNSLILKSIENQKIKFDSNKINNETDFLEQSFMIAGIFNDLFENDKNLRIKLQIDNFIDA